MSLSKRDRRVQRLDLLNYQEKSFRWKREDPVGNGFGLPEKPELSPEQVKTDGLGNILSIPQFAEKPCFGIPTAWLRHAHLKPVYVNRTGRKEHNSRCDRCLAAKACKSVVLERIKAVARRDSDFAEAFKAWSKAGGLRKGGFDVACEKLNHRGWSALTYPLEIAEFADANAAYVRKYWIEKERKAANIAAGKERHRLRQAWKSGEDLDRLRSGLDEGTKLRAIALHEAIIRDQPPKYLLRYPSRSIARVCRVWWSREFARYTGQDRNPSRIATIAVKEGRINEYGHTSLRQMVKRDLLLIKKLESSAGYNGGSPIWPKFNHPAVSIGVT
ncbi:hypothetical protein K3179_10185 [Qipengyuania sp. GH38]|uniref:hypothetical protein n=1 Tax=Qipengyuania intermedia TaxID=2867244 RepID=UPI001C87239E|nr:hypothetical protein [Qipengyuania intermedia]MBX7514909.1 hypothetical protein [Qipengyuania intermedia]